MTHPLLYQINTRVFLQERGVALNRAATLDWDWTSAWRRSGKRARTTRACQTSMKVSKTVGAGLSSV